MPLQRANPSFPLSGGVDERTRPELVEPGTALLAVEGMVYDQAGGLTKTLGCTALASTLLSGGSRTSGKRVFRHGKTHGVLGADSLDTYSEELGEYVRRGHVIPVTARRHPVATLGASTVTIVQSDVVVLGDLAILAYTLNTAGNPCYLASFDLVSRSLLKVVAYKTGALVALGMAGGNLFAFVGTTSTTIDVEAIDPETLVGTATGIPPFARKANYRFDVCSDGARCVLARLVDDPVDPVTNTVLSSVDSTGAPISSATIVNGGMVNWVSVEAFPGGHLWLLGASDTEAFAEATALTSISNLTVEAGPTGVLSAEAGDVVVKGIGIVPTTTNTAVATGYGGTNGVSDSGVAYARHLELSGATITPSTDQRKTWGRVTVTAPIFVDGRVFVGAIRMPTGGQSGFQMIDVTDEGASIPAEPILHVPMSAVPLSVRGAARLARYGNRRAVVPLIVQTNAFSTRLDLAILEWRSAAAGSPATFGDLTALALACPRWFDGYKSAEVGFLDDPIQEVTKSATGFTGTVAVTAVYYHVDNAGNVHISEPSNAVALTLANERVVVRVRNLTVTSRESNKIQDDVFIAVYGSTGGPYRLWSTKKNDPTTEFQTFTLTTAPATSQPSLYTTPGEPGAALERGPFPAALAIVQHLDRLAVIADDARTVWVSSYRVPGEGPWTSPAFQYAVEGSGDLVALASQDGVLIVFAESSIHVIEGDGPPENGGNGTEFASPRRVSSDVGCIDPRSVVTCSVGTFFQSARGIELFARSREVQWIGEKVQVTLGVFPIITSAVVDEEAARVLFTCVVSEVDGVPAVAGCTLVFDLTSGAWTVDQRSGYSAASSACMAYSGSDLRYHWLASGGTVSREETASYLDAGTWKTPLFETPSIRLAMLQDQRLWSIQLLFDRHTAHGLSVAILYDYGNTVAETKTWTDAEFSSLASGVCEVEVTNQKAFAVRLRVTQTEPTDGALGSGRGSTFIGFTPNFAARPDSTKGTPRLALAARK